MQHKYKHSTTLPYNKLQHFTKNSHAGIQLFKNVAKEIKNIKDNRKL